MVVFGKKAFGHLKDTEKEQRRRGHILSRSVAITVKLCNKVFLVETKKLQKVKKFFREKNPTYTCFR